MSVIVKGMDMPQDCFECDFQNPFVEEPYCRRLLKRCPKTSRLEDCPLGEVPTPHGRLIDADKLINALPKAEADIFENCRNCTCLDTEQIQEIIGDAPTAIEAEGGEND